MPKGSPNQPVLTLEKGPGHVLLKLIKEDQCFVVETDASNRAISAALS